jgi:RNA polymerase sigma-70 factor (ECF subfamily)
MSTLSPAAFAIETEKYRQRIARYVRYLLHDAAEAEDLTQEILLRAFQQQETLRDPAALEGWIYRIATRISLDRIRQRKRTSGRHVASQVEELPIIDRKQPSPFIVIQQSEMSDCVTRYVTELSDSYKAVILLHDADELTAEEIAALLCVPLSTVKIRLHRARKRLKAALDNACKFGRDDRGVFICEPKSSNE